MDVRVECQQASGWPAGGDSKRIAHHRPLIDLPRRKDANGDREQADALKEKAPAGPWRPELPPGLPASDRTSEPEESRRDQDRRRLDEGRVAQQNAGQAGPDQCLFPDPHQEQSRPRRRERQQRTVQPEAGGHVGHDGREGRESGRENRLQPRDRIEHGGGEKHHRPEENCVGQQLHQRESRFPEEPV